MTDIIDSFMKQLRERGRARLINGRLGDPLEVMEVTAIIMAQPDIWGDGEPPYNEESVITLDTLEAILRWGRTWPTEPKLSAMDRIRGLHRLEHKLCVTCKTPWPCETMRTLHLGSGEEVVQ